MLEINRNPTPRELRQFAAIWFPAFAAMVGGMLYWKAQQPRAAWLVWGIGAALSLVGFFTPRFMRLVYVGLMIAVFPIGWVVSHLLMTVLYFLVLTPIALLMRLFGHDPLHRRLDRQATTYWVGHDPGERADRYFRQF
jgi:hypothetical protein